MNGTHQLLVYTDGGNLLATNLTTIKKSKEAVLDASKVVGLEVNKKLSSCSCLITRTQDKIS
jgi:hypothetical protein